MYTSNDRLQYNESMLRWKEELAAYMVDSSLVKMEESLGEGHNTQPMMSLYVYIHECGVTRIYRLFWHST